MINLPNITAAHCINPPAGNGICPDGRCSDATFAANNPDICPGGVVSPAEAVLVLKPSSLLLCPTSTTQMATFVSINGAESPVSGVAYSSSNAAVASVNASTGLVTGVATGIVTITAQWQGMSASSQVSVIGEAGNCCEGITVAMALVIDRSFSMSLPFDANYSSKLAYAKALADDFASGLNITKDMLGLIQFTASPDVLVSPTNSVSAVQTAINGIAQDTAQYDTDIASAIKSAVTMLAGVTANMKVIVLLSDGNIDLPPTSQNPNDPVVLANLFKSGGGIVVGVGIRAAGSGYTEMVNIASDGYFLNAIPDNEAATFTNLSGLKGYFCAGSCNVTGGYGHGCLSSPPPSQVPDPNPQADNETGSQVNNPPPPPPRAQLPRVAFSPISGTVDGSGGLTVTLSCPGYPAALIRYTLDGNNEPGNPSFVFPSSPQTGIDYDGSNVPISILPTSAPNLPRVKAIARLAGFADSVISEASYPPV